jgi:predicted Zn-dependent protease
MNRKKIMLFVWLVVFIGGATGIAYVGGRALLLRRALSIKAHGLEAARDGDDARAVDLLLQYIRRRPRDTDAVRAYIASRKRVPMTNAQQYAETIGVLQLLIAAEPGNLDDQRYLLELDAKLERGPEAIDLANAILAKVPNDSKTLQIKTEVLIREQSNQEALQTAEKWAAAAPDDIHAHMARLTLYSQLGRPPQSIIDDATALLQAHPGDAKFEILQGVAYARAGQNYQAQALACFQTATKHPDLDDGLAQILVDQFDGLGRTADALSLLQNRVSKGASSDVRYALARRLWELGRWQDTVNALSDVKSGDTKADPTLLAMKAVSLSTLQKPADAGAYCKTLSQIDRPDAHAWSSLLAGLIQGQKVDDKQLAADCRDGVRFDSSNPYLTYYLGETEFRLGDIDLALTDFSRAAALDIHWDVPGVRITDCLLAKGQPEQAKDVAAYFFAHRNQNNVALAVAFARAWAASVEAGQAGQADNLLTLIADLQKALPADDNTLPTIKAEILAQQGRKDDAIQSIRQTLARTPPPPEDTFRALAIVSSRYSLGLEGECYAAWQHAYGITSNLAYLEAVNQFAAGHPKDGLQLFDTLAQQNHKSGDVDWRLARARYLDATSDPGAKADWTALVNAFPDNLPVQQAAVNAACARGDWNFLEPVIEHLHKITGDNGLAWQMAHAALLVQSARSDSDYQQGSLELNALIAKYPQLAEPHVLLAQALVHMKRLDGALDHLTTASKLDPASFEISTDLIRLLQSRGDSAKAGQELDRLTKEPLNSEQRQQVAVLLANQGSPDRAVTLLQQPSQSQSPTSQPAHSDSQQFLLAVLYRQQRQIDKADAIVRELLNRPSLPLIQFAASLFLQEGKTADALKTMQLLDGLKLPSGDEDMAWGNFYYGQLRDMAKAAERFAAATKEVPANVSTWKALAVCQMSQGQIAPAMKTISDALNTIPHDSDLAAIEKQASLIADAASDNQLRPVAISAIENPQDTVAFDLMRVVVQDHKANNLVDLADQLHQLGDAHTDYLPIQLQLANCELNMGNSTAALATAQHAMAIFPNNPQPAQLAVEISSRAQRWEDMKSAAENWKSRSPDDAELASAAAAAADNHLQDYQSASNEIAPYLDMAKSNPDRHFDVLNTYFVASAGLGNTSAISDFLQPLAAKSPNWRACWLQLAVEVQDSDVTNQWLKTIAALIPPDSLVERCSLAEAYDTRGHVWKNPDQIAQASAMFDQLTKDPRASAIVFLSAGAEAQRNNQPTQAESLYRHALALDPSQWIAANNIASYLCMRNGDPKEALQFAQIAVKAQPQNADVRDTLAQAQAKSGDPAAAADTMRVATQLAPNELVWRVRLAQYLFAAGQLAQATDTIDAADTAFPDIQNQPADVQQQLSDLRKKIHGKGT